MEETQMDNVANTKALVVDDEFIQAERNCRILQGAGVKECRYVPDYESAIDMYKAMRPEIVVPDIHLSPDRDRDGFSLIHALRMIARNSGWCEPYCIFITGFEVDEAQERALELPGSILIEKPIHDKLLVEKYLAVAARLPEWRLESVQISRNPITWNEELDIERIHLAEEEYKLRKSGRVLDRRSFRRLKKLQEVHGEWLRRKSPLNMSRIEAALQQLRDLPPA